MNQKVLKINASSYIFTPPPASFPKYLQSFTTICLPTTTPTGTTIYNPSTTTSPLPTTSNSATTTTTNNNNKNNTNNNATTVTNNTSDYGCKIYYRDCHEVTCLSCFCLNCLSGMEEETGMDTNKSLEDMVRELSEGFGVQLEQTTSLTETIDIYDAYVSSERASRNAHLSDVRDKVMFPILAAKSLDNTQKLSKLGSFKFCNGGRFISD
jgi:hypothetical protein